MNKSLLICAFLPLAAVVDAGQPDASDPSAMSVRVFLAKAREGAAPAPAASKPVRAETTVPAAPALQFGQYRRNTYGGLQISPGDQPNTIIVACTPIYMPGDQSGLCRAEEGLKSPNSYVFKYENGAYRSGQVDAAIFPTSPCSFQLDGFFIVAGAYAHSGCGGGSAYSAPAPAKRQCAHRGRCIHYDYIPVNCGLGALGYKPIFGKACTETVCTEYEQVIEDCDD